MEYTKEKAGYLVSIDGEINATIYEGDSVRIRTEEQKQYTIDYFINYNKGRKFMKFFNDSMDKLLDELTPHEYVFITRLLPYISYKDCVLRKSNGGDLLTMKDIAQITKLEYSAVTKKMSSLCEKGVIGLHEVGSILPQYYGKLKKVYTVNPNIFQKGTDINRFVIEFYKNAGW